MPNFYFDDWHGNLLPPPHFSPYGVLIRPEERKSNQNKLVYFTWLDPISKKVKSVSTEQSRLPLFQVYAASNVELITRTRTDHLSDQNKNKTKGRSFCFVSDASWWASALSPLRHRQGLHFVQLHHGCGSWMSSSPLCCCKLQPECVNVWFKSKESLMCNPPLTWARWHHPEAPANSPERSLGGSVSFSGSDHKSNRISRLPSPDSRCQPGSTITHSSEGSALPGHDHHLHYANIQQGRDLESAALTPEWVSSSKLSFVILLTLENALIAIYCLVEGQNVDTCLINHIMTPL